MTAVDKEIDRLDRTASEAAEHGWIRTWLDTVFEAAVGRRAPTTTSTSTTPAPCSTPTTTASTT